MLDRGIWTFDKFVEFGHLINEYYLPYFSVVNTEY